MDRKIPSTVTRLTLNSFPFLFFSRVCLCWEWSLSSLAPWFGFNLEQISQVQIPLSFFFWSQRKEKVRISYTLGKKRKLMSNWATACKTNLTALNQPPHHFIAAALVSPFEYKHKHREDGEKITLLWHSLLIEIIGIQILHACLLHLLRFLAWIILRVTKGSQHPIHPYGIMAIVMLVCSMMNCVVPSTHYGP
jgi:hypothetical protein